MSLKKWQWAPMLAIMLVVALASVVGAQTHKGALVDRVIFVEEQSEAQGVTRVEVGEFDLYAQTLTRPDLFDRTVASPFMTYSQSFGSYTELTFNPSGPEFQDGRLNPFSVARIREAMNWLIDRDYIVNEIYGGMAVPKFFPITSAFPDYARLADVAMTLELKYAHDPQRAADIISEEMVKLGASLVNGVWHYKGAPVEILALIRIEDERRIVGDYVSSLLEDIGFQVTRLYRSAADASPLWYSADPSEGRMHFYTGGWITTAVSRDQSDNFDYFYTPRGLATPLWFAYNPSEDFDRVSQLLDRQEFRTMEERAELFAEAMELALQDSARVWLVDQLAFTPRRSDILVAADMAGAVGGSWLWAATLQRAGQIGGDVTIGIPSILTEPWNPLAGTNWIYDMMLIRGISEAATVPDPYTGLAYPRRIERAEVTLLEGLPVGKTLDWIDLSFSPEPIEVPGDAWIDWDPVEQRFITVAEKHPEGLTALRKSVVYYPADMSETVTWHDGSPVTVGDFVIGMILTHDRAKEASEFYDSSAAPGYQSFMVAHKGERIVSTNPLIIETYSDTYALDAELNVTTHWPQYTFGPGPWHTLAIGLLSEANQDTAFSSAKASELGVEWLNMIGGPSLAALERHLAQARASNHIPYAPTLSQFISAEEAAQRYANLSKWYADRGHFFLGTGVLYLHSVHPVEGSAVLARYENHPDRADRWSIFAEPMYAEVEVEGPARVSAGRSARFDIWVTFDGEPYPSDLLNVVSYVVVDANGNVAFTGEAEFVADGLYEVVLTSEQTAELPVGANLMNAIVVPIPVAKPTFEAATFVVTP